VHCNVLCFKSKNMCGSRIGTSRLAVPAADAKRARDEPRHDDEGPGHQQNRAERKWSWKGFSHVGEELFDILADPRRNTQFRAFMHEPLDLLAGCPLESRYGVIRASPLKGRDSIEGKGEVDWSDDLISLTLRELVAILFVARDAMSPVSLRMYLYVSASGVDRARTLPEACFRKATIDSAVTRSALSNAPTSAWYVDGKPDDIASGEALESKNDYRRWVRKRRDGGTGGLRTCGSLSRLSAPALHRAACREDRRPPPRRTTSSATMNEKMRKEVYAAIAPRN
jgi:hypothetical protein